ncbi:protein neprosin-like [Nicotiana tabacum]|uniref:Protein neprosin-like n=1 Tax=Nicotiana tabacum TaxID=4097 RepID=A0AC58U000_TOBAC
MKTTRIHLSVIQLLIAILVYLNHDEVEGLSKKDHEALERQLKFLNKPAVKTIKTEYEDIYDCVDFYQQPAFDHPLLKNHTYHPQMKPSLSLLKRNKKSSTSNSSSGIGLNDGGCPMGTVPIRRTTKEDLIRERRFNTSYVGGVFHFALEQTINDPNLKISGAGTISSIYNPKVLSNQWSASIVKVQNGRDQIQAGWRVDPILYGDTRTRFFSLFKAGTTQCFNTRCPGFVIVNTQIPLDMVLLTSTPGRIFDQTFFIQRDLKNGRWWLRYSHDFTQIGFWPSELFTGLKGFASQAAWGGEAFSSVPTFPPMGSGRFPKFVDTDKDAFCSKISILDSVGNTRDPAVSSFEDAHTLYRVANKPITNKEIGHAVFYGGPGSNK